MRIGRVVMLITGCLSALCGLALLTAAGFVLWGYYIQRDGGEITLPQEKFQTSSAALLSDDIRIFDSASRPELLGVDDLGRITLRATPADPGSAVFVGVGPTEQVERYLDDVAHTVIGDLNFDPFRVRYEQVPGTTVARAPTSETFWAAQSAGPDRQQLSWDLQDGSWTMVVMNADGSPGVSVALQAGVRFDFLGPLAAVLLVGAGVLLLVGAPLIVFGAIGLGRQLQPRSVGPTPGGPPVDTTHIGRASPITLTGRLDQPLSRWLWLVKWLLAIPHYIVLMFLGIAFVITTVVAGFAILFTGRYPRGIFEFNVGVLRWVWRVQFYTYSALATDRYPPFTLRRTDYPADLTVDYPETLSRGLVLVKWWLLAIPHYVILAVLAGGWYAGFRIAGDNGDVGAAGQPWFFSSVLGLVVAIVAICLLFTARYPQGLFDFVMGINRWAYRVIAYAALMRDDYPPMRLDQGADEPDSAPLQAPEVDSPSKLQPAGSAMASTDRAVQPPHPRDWFNG